METNQKLDELVAAAVKEEQTLQVASDKLALQNKDFADFLEKQKKTQDKLDVLWAEVKIYMEENGIKEHSNDYIKLTLSPSGRYRAVDIDKAPDSLCDIKKTLNNKKVTAYLELTGKLPEGIESTGNVLRKKLLNKEN